MDCMIEGCTNDALTTYRTCGPCAAAKHFPALADRGQCRCNTCAAEAAANMAQAEHVAEPMLKLAIPTDDRTILIEATERGYRAKFPYKPCDSAIKGFHQAKMVWSRGTSVVGVYWTIPADKLDFAKDIIGYWFTESPSDDGLNRQGKACYRVEVAGQNAPATVRWDNRQYAETAKAAGGVLVIRKEAA